MTRRPPAARVAVVLLALLAGVSPFPAGPGGAAAAAPAKINGSGSSYVALAMQQWVADAQVDGLSINYTPSGSPNGLQTFASGLTDFAGTEAEYSALGGSEPTRGFQYVPDVAGAVAIMYNVVDKAGRKVDYLHLRRRTVARIFMGDISRWSDPAISDDNKGLELPDEPINVIYRGGQSGTTALFYDFVAKTAPDVFGPWAAKHGFPTAVRIIQLDVAQDFAPHTQSLATSDQIAQQVASASGRWSISYEEFGYAKVYKASTAWIENQAGEWVLPFAQNISAALESARLRADLSQDLDGVYTSADPDAYPISAYSYLVTQCAAAGDRPTCKKDYDNPGISETLATWMRYIACQGQVNMASIGYSPLPANLSQEMANSIGRLKGTAPEQLTADNCANPRFRGSLGAGSASPKDPLANVETLVPGASTGVVGGGTGDGEPAAGSTGATGSGGGEGATVAGGGGGAGGSDASGAGGGSSAGSAAGPVGVAGGSARAVGGGTGQWRAAAPVVYDRPTGPGPSFRPMIVLLTLLCIPPLFAVLRRLR